MNALRNLLLILVTQAACAEKPTPTAKAPPAAKIDADSPAAATKADADPPDAAAATATKVEPGLPVAAAAKADAGSPATPAVETAKAATVDAGVVSSKFVLNGDPTKGETTYKTYCVSCHGEKGAGDGAAAVALNPKPANFNDPKLAALATDEYIYKMVRDGGAANGKSAVMVAWGPVLGEDQKIRDVAAYVRAFSKPAATAAPKQKKKT